MTKLRVGMLVNRAPQQVQTFPEFVGQQSLHLEQENLQKRPRKEFPSALGISPFKLHVHHSNPFLSAHCLTAGQQFAVRDQLPKSPHKETEVVRKAGN